MKKKIGPLVCRSLPERTLLIIGLCIVFCFASMRISIVHAEDNNSADVDHKLPQKNEEKLTPQESTKQNDEQAAPPNERSETQPSAKSSTKSDEKIKGQHSEPLRLASGLEIQDLLVGTGPSAKRNDRISVHYTGRLSDQSIFDSSRKRGQAFEFTLGAGEVIKGWEDGVLGMRVGGRRRLVVPASLAYGARGTGKIPPGATLSFDIELVAVNGDETGRLPSGTIKEDDSPESQYKGSESKTEENPLFIPPDAEQQIGSSYDGRLPGSPGKLEQSFRPYYEEKRSDYRLRLVPPFFLEHTKGLGKVGPSGLSLEDKQGLYGLFYYRRRSLKLDMDVIFPLVWRVRENQNNVFVAGPFLHREAPNEHDNWLAPLFFQGSRGPDGGYLHIPPLLLFSDWSSEKAFTLAGPYFRSRHGSDLDWGIVPFVFHGDNGNTYGARRRYTVITPLLYYHQERELDHSSFTVAGPVIVSENLQRNIVNVLPFYWSIRGKPESGGIKESHTTLFPFFHYGKTPEQKLLVLPGLYYRKTASSETILTPFYSHATTRNLRTSLTLAGPVVPLFYHYADYDVGQTDLGVFPFFFDSKSHRYHSTWTPLYYHETHYGESKSFWIFPTITGYEHKEGHSFNIYPLVFTGRDGASTHAIFAPFFWRFQNEETGSLTQLALNTLYIEKKVVGGTDWEFHLLPLFSYGKNPAGYFWNVLFGLAGYTRSGQTGTGRALWIPFKVHGPD